MPAEKPRSYKFLDLSHAYPKTRWYLLDAQRSGAIDTFVRTPKGIEGSKPQRSRTDELRLVEIFFPTDQTKMELGRSFDPDDPISGERVRQIIDSVLKGIRRHLPPGLQSIYPATEISTDKPFTLHRALIMSEANGGRMALVANQVASGKTYQEIRNAVGGPNTMGRVRIPLGKYGVRVPFPEGYDDELIAKRYEKLKDPDLSFRELKELLSLMSDDQIRSMIYDRNDLFTSLNECRRKAKLYPKSTAYDELATVLEKNGIAVASYHNTTLKRRGTEIQGHAVRKVDEERSVEILKTDPDLEKHRKNPVSVVSGNPEILPTSYRLRRTDEYRNLGAFTRRLELGLRGIDDLEEFFSSRDCPGEIYRVGRYGLFYRRTDEKALEVFIARQRRSRGL